MKTTITLLLASAALTTAQVKYNDTDGTFTCVKPDAAYCAGDSLNTDIIIRCNGTAGQPGRCGNNLAGYPPLGSGGALCWQSSPTSGDAACEKNCIVYAPSSSWTLPASLCTPSYTATSSSATATSTSSSLTTTTTPTSYSHSSSRTVVTETTTTLTTDCSSTTDTTSYTKPTTYPPHFNGTSTIHTKTPTSTPPAVTAGAAANMNGAVGALAVVGVVAAWVL